jgi:Leucine-rich repeat (LRR) protein
MFEQNNWTTLPRHMFQHLSGANLVYISLNYNNLKKLYFNIFRPLSGLKRLSCRENAIAYMNVSTFHTLQHLDLSENNFYVMPTFCDVINNKSAVPLLKNLSLFNNAIRDISIRSIKCLENLESLILDGNRIRTLDNNVFSTLIKLITLSLCNLPQLKNINSTAFNSSSLQILIFNKNRYRFDKKIRYDSKEIEIFHFLPNIRELHLAQNYLPKDDNILRQMFEHLTNLRKINLHSTYISLVPEVLNTLPHLNSIILQGNKIDRWNASTFENMTSLRKLNIAGNTIHIINKTSFPMSLLNGLETFDLSTNPYWCTCDQKWFLDTIRLTNLTKKMTSEWPSYYTCSYPERLRFTMLSNYNPTDSDCTPWNVISLIIITVSSAVLVIFCVVIVLFRCQINIKNVLYFVRVYRQATKGYLQLDSSDEFEFDAFVVYCDADRQWVHNVLLKKLESSNLNICIHHRDFDVGKHITNNIEKYMSKCWKIIVVM